LHVFELLQLLTEVQAYIIVLFRLEPVSC